MTRQAVIDVGTNSVKFHVGELQADGTWTTVVDRAEVSRLGEGIDETGAIAPAAMERTAAGDRRHDGRGRRRCVDGITAVGTMGLRTATNSQAFLDLVKKRCGVAIEVISGEDECRLAYLAVRSASGLADGSLVVFDTGGGSSQFTFGDGNSRRSTVQRQRGCRALHRAISPRPGGECGCFETGTRGHRLGPAGDRSHRGIRGSGETGVPYLGPSFDGTQNGRRADSLVGMGGAVTNITAVMLGLAKYDPDKVQGSVIDRTEIDRQIELYRAIPAEERRQIVGLQPKRAEVILAGACIVRTIMDKLGKSSLSVSDRGLRHGLLIDRFGGQPGPNRPGG